MFSGLRKITDNNAKNVLRDTVTSKTLKEVGGYCSNTGKDDRV